MNPKKIVCITPWFLPRYGGGEVQVEKISAYLTSKKMPCKICTLHFGKGPKHEMLPSGVEIERFGGISTISERKRGFRGIISYIENNKDQVCMIYMHLGVASDLPVEEECAMIDLAKQLGLPITIRVTSDGRIKGLLQMLPSALVQLEKVDLFIALNNNIKKDLLSRDIPLRRILRIDNGVDSRKFFSASRTEKSAIRRKLGISDKVTFICHTRLSSKKNIPLIVDSWKIFCDNYPHLSEKCQLVIVGDNNNRTENIASNRKLRQMVKKLNMPNIIIHKSVRHSDIAPYVRMADFYTNLSLQEGMSNSTLEAMSSGLACILSGTGVNKYLTLGKGGYIVSVLAPGAIAEVFAKSMLDFPSKSVAMGGFNRKRVVGHFDERIILPEYYKRFKGLIG